MTAVRGWCPSVLKPMAAGDGLLVRIRPLLGRIDAAQALVVAEAARTYGSGAIDLTNRGALQLRGVSEQGWPSLVETLDAAGLVEEAGPPVLVAPDWIADDDTHRIANAIHARRHAFPSLPAKLGIVVDAGPQCALASAPGDFRIERTTTGDLMLRGAGRKNGARVQPGNEVDALIALAQWFAASGTSGRMASLDAALPDVATGDLRAATGAAPPTPGPHMLGTLIAAPFGRIDADLLSRLVAAGATAIRVTPWRMLIAENVSIGVTGATPSLTIDACVGAPACPQASVATRDLALRLAPLVTDLHVSGCAKGCARARPAAVVLTGRDGRFDLAHDAKAGAPPLRTALTPAELMMHFGAD